jgi:hypothetical protein
MSNYYIFQGGPELIKYWVGPDAEQWQSHRWWWSANKHVVPGDKAFIYLTSPQSRIVGEVDVIGKPFMNGPPYAFDNAHMSNKWCAEVGNPKGYGNSYMLSMFNLRKLFSTEWGWVRYPRGNTRVPDEILPAMLEIAKQELKRNRPPCHRRGCVEGFITSEAWHERKKPCPDCNGH